MYQIFSDELYQCKHYDHALQPAEFWPELAKFFVMASSGLIPVPQHYCIVAPQDTGPDLTALLDEPANELREIPHRYSPRFGGGLIKPLPPDKLPPDKVAAEEQKYVACLVDAYRHHKNDAFITCDTLDGYLHEHFRLSRERYYCAETIKEFSRDTLPEPFTFEDVQGQVYYSVVDTAHRPDHADAYIRVIEVVKVAQTTQISNHPLRSYLKAKSLQGICHQLANEEKLKWVL